MNKIKEFWQNNMDPGTWLMPLIILFCLAAIIVIWQLNVT